MSHPLSLPLYNCIQACSVSFSLSEPHHYSFCQSIFLHFSSYTHLKSLSSIHICLRQRSSQYTTLHITRYQFLVTPKTYKFLQFLSLFQFHFLNLSIAYCPSVRTSNSFFLSSSIIFMFSVH